MTSLESKLLTRLKRLNVLTEDQARQIEEACEASGRPVAERIVELGYADEKLVTRNLSRLSGLEFLDLETFTPEKIVLRHLRASVARRYQAVPVGIVGEDLVVAVADFTNIYQVDDLKAITGRPIRIVAATHAAIQAALERCYSLDEMESSDQVPVQAIEPEEESQGDVLPENQSILEQAPRRDLSISSDLTEAYDPQTMADEPTPRSSEVIERLHNGRTRADIEDTTLSEEEAPGQNFATRDHEAATQTPDAIKDEEAEEAALEEQRQARAEAEDRGAEVPVNEDSTVRLKAIKPPEDVETPREEPPGPESPERETGDSMEAKLPAPETVEEAGSVHSQPTRIVARPDEEDLLEPARAGTLEDLESHARRRTPSRALTPLPISSDEVLIQEGADELIASLDGEEEQSVSMLLKHMIDDALAAQAEELELAPPSGKQTRCRIRKSGIWRDLMPYPVKYHEALSARLRELADVPRKDRKPAEKNFFLKGKKGDIAVVALFSSTLRGDRCVLRFPENVPLIQNPLRILGLSEDLTAEMDERLGGAGGGLFFITSEYSRLCSQFYASILFAQATTGRSVVSLEQRVERMLPDLTQVPCETPAELIEQLEHFVIESPDLCGVAAIPTSEILRQVLSASLHGRSLVGCCTAANSRLGLALYTAAGIDPMTLTRGVIAHAHVSQVPRLCGKCREAMTAPPRRMPSWAGGLAGKRLYEAKGCEHCGGTGRFGTSWVAEVFQPKSSGRGGFEAIRPREEALCQLAEEAWLDVRDVR